jgi:tyrosine-protein phosphatase SIW14
MSRFTVGLSLVLIVLIVGIPLLYKTQKDQTFRNFRVVEDGQLYRSGQMSAAGFETVCRERGIRTVIKLRDSSDKPSDIATDAAEEEYCLANGIEFIRLLPKEWEPNAAGFVPMEENLRWFEQTMDDPTKTPRPVLIHCFAGIHRTGSMVAVYRMKYQGWTNAQAVAELKACGKATSTYYGNLVPFISQYKPLPSLVGKPAPGR